ncbi:hypothetical protein [Bradyrhizobium sp. 199]|uniref:hypothetical protein n=1 Tax=Bradyrhizobium sp. 199 TaxID=2782664 RepID=UPI00201C162B|nr:hypothetical protein [Bradyrhizobium sp. 199]
MAGKRLGDPGEGEAFGDVDQRIVAVEIEVWMHRCVGVEERLDAVAAIRRSRPASVNWFSVL